MKFINVNDLFELFRLCALILTIPSTTASVARSFSTLQKIKTYQKNTTGEKRILGLSLISIEADPLNQGWPTFFPKSPILFKSSFICPTQTKDFKIS